MLHIFKPDEFLDHLFTFHQRKLDLSLCIEFRSIKYFQDQNPLPVKPKKVDKLRVQGSISNSINL